MQTLQTVIHQHYLLILFLMELNIEQPMLIQMEAVVHSYTWPSQKIPLSILSHDRITNVLYHPIYHSTLFID